MVYINVNGTPEGEKRCRQLNLRAQAEEEQREAMFRDYCATLAPDARAEIRTYLQSSKKAQRWLAVFRQFNIALPTTEHMLAIIESHDNLAVPSSETQITPQLGPD